MDEQANFTVASQIETELASIETIVFIERKKWIFNVRSSNYEHTKGTEREVEKESRKNQTKRRAARLCECIESKHVLAWDGCARRLRMLSDSLRMLQSKSTAPAARISLAIAQSSRCRSVSTMEKQKIDQRGERNKLFVHALSQLRTPTKNVLFYAALFRRSRSTRDGILFYILIHFKLLKKMFYEEKGCTTK